MTTITIPPAALEAARHAFYDAEASRKSTDDALRTAILAALEAWTGMQVRLNYFQPTEEVILPLNTENTDAEA